MSLRIINAKRSLHTNFNTKKDPFHRNGSIYFIKKKNRNYFLLATLYLLKNLSTRPAVSTNLAFPV